jgi:hypothetical protein
MDGADDFDMLAECTGRFSSVNGHPLKMGLFGKERELSGRTCAQHFPLGP